MISITRVEELVDRLTRPTYVLRLARPMRHSSRPGMAKSAETRITRALYDIKTTVDVVTGAVATETALWDRAETSAVHARRYAQMARDRSRYGEQQLDTHREMSRIYETKTSAYLDAIALLRVGGHTSQVALAHALRDVRHEFGRRMPR